MTWRSGQAYGQDLRDRVLAASGSIARVAARFDVSPSYVARARSRRRRLGQECPGVQCNHVIPKLGALEPALAAEVERGNDQTLAQLCDWAEREHGVRAGVTTMWKTLQRLGLTLEKKCLHASEQERADVAAARTAWADERQTMRPPRLVFLDETWATTSMTPTRGRAAKGQRCLGKAPHSHWHTTTLVCALRHDGLIAPCVLDGPINGETFRAWVQQFLAAELRPGDIVVMDNLGSHKVAGIRQAIEAQGASIRYLPPYSPDFNPIEQVFAKLKTLLRSAAARAQDALWHTIGLLLDRFSAQECANYIRHCGYGSSG